MTTPNRAAVIAATRTSILMDLANANAALQRMAAANTAALRAQHFRDFLHPARQVLNRFSGAANALGFNQQGAALFETWLSRRENALEQEAWDVVTDLRHENTHRAPVAAERTNAILLTNAGAGIVVNSHGNVVTVAIDEVTSSGKRYNCLQVATVCMGLLSRFVDELETALAPQ